MNDLLTVHMRDYLPRNGFLSARHLPWRPLDACEEGSGGGGGTSEELGGGGSGAWIFLVS